MIKYLLISFGAEIGSLDKKRLLNPLKSEPSEKATLAKRAEETIVELLLLNKNISIMRLLAPIIFTGLAALSVETQNYLLAPLEDDISKVLIVLIIFTLIMRIKVYGSFSLRTCFKADKFNT